MTAPDSPQSVALRVPAHGHGLLRVGGTNRGGPGRPAKAVIERFRQLADDAAEALAKHLDGTQALTIEQLTAIANLGAKYGLPRDGASDNAPMLSAEARKARLMAILMQLSPADRARLLSGTGLLDPTQAVEPAP